MLALAEVSETAFKGTISKERRPPARNDCSSERVRSDAREAA
jgi:hypothetical protein